jgi:transposase-like protein
MATEKEKKPVLQAHEIAKLIEENTAMMTRDIITETVKKKLNEIIQEDAPYEEEDVDEKKTETPQGEESENINIEKEASNGGEETAPPAEGDTGDDLPFDENEEDTEGAEEELTDGFQDEDVIDMTDGASDEEIIRVYKKMNNNDRVIVTPDANGDIEITDRESGESYLVKTTGNDSSQEPETPGDDGEDVFTDDSETVFEMDFNRLYKSLVNEEDLGYTTKYQKETAVSTGGVSGNAKGTTRDWDKGVPDGGDSKRSYGEPGKSNPFEKKVSVCEEDDTVDEGEDILDEAGLTRTKSNLRQRAGQKATPQIDYTQGKRVDKVRQGTSLATGEGTSDTATAVTEQRLKKLEEQLAKITEKNKKLKEAVIGFHKSANEYYQTAMNGMITNHKLGQIINLFSEHSTTRDEKKSIIERYEKEASDIASADKLFECLKSELSTKKTINESLADTSLATATSAGNRLLKDEPVYMNEEIKRSRDLMQRMLMLH